MIINSQKHDTLSREVVIDKLPEQFGDRHEVVSMSANV